MLIDFTSKSIRVDPSDRPGMLVLRAASTHDVNAQLTKGSDAESRRIDGGLPPDEYWESERVGPLRRFSEWHIRQETLDDESQVGSEFAFVLESAYLVEEEDAETFGQVVLATLRPTVGSGWSIGLALAGDQYGMSVSINIEDFDPCRDSSFDPNNRPMSDGESREDYDTCYDRLME